MPKLRLFRGPDPLETDTIPFPRIRPASEPFKLRLTDSAAAIRQVEDALEHVQGRLNDARSMLDDDWFDGDDGPKAA